MAVYNWASDGINMTKNVAKDLINIKLNNSLVNKNFIVNDVNIDIENLEIPLLIATAKKDMIVPLASSEPLLEFVQQKNSKYYHHIEVDSGHIGLIASNNTQQELLVPLINWLQEIT